MTPEKQGENFARIKTQVKSIVLASVPMPVFNKDQPHVKGYRVLLLDLCLN